MTEDTDMGRTFGRGRGTGAEACRGGEWVRGGAVASASIESSTEFTRRPDAAGAGSWERAIDSAASAANGGSGRGRIGSPLRLRFLLRVMYEPSDLSC